MEEIKKKGSEKSNAAIILLAIILSLAIIGVIFWFVFKFLISGANENLLLNALEDRVSCRQDADCVLISKYYANQYGQSACCPMNCEQEAVNIATKTKDAVGRVKLCATKDYQCPISEQCAKRSLKLVCENNLCAVKDETSNYE